MTITPYLSSQRNSDFYHADLSYADYISSMRDIIAETRTDITASNQDRVIHANSPAEFVPSATPINNGILLVHGLLDSPLSMQSLFEHYKAQNFLVRSLLLPGHGTVPGDLLAVNMEAWINSINYAIARCKEQVDNLYIAGFSTGANLALLQGHLDPAVKGLILIAPAIKIKNPLAPLSRWHKTFARLGQRGQWICRTKENDFAKYQSFTFNSVAQVVQLEKTIAQYERAHFSDTPIFMVVSDDDETIDPHAAETFFTQQTHPSSRLLIYSNKRTSHTDPRIELTPSNDPEHNILDYSHICLVIAPEHSHYGINGDYYDLQHYEQWWGKPFRKNRHLPLHYGAINKHNLCNYHLSRLQYNPDFSTLVGRIDEFISRNHSVS